ncbi:flagellar biosynthesis anti-sigma factor FlgM [Sphingomonas japonica]|uniref:Negative regulator of flagellin synthesis n=1 Tax=Sphingomonas japonica TaxID=511662 RepID=A0ABX0U5D3_9SPHN|nr:flagellar biosynthesis anti-sigma factor FlgM [Sphingomonas japonica]NIJ23988.1 negative regulator of flagellin synthesis FlgM [Sphingomonas japonica]
MVDPIGFKPSTPVDRRSVARVSSAAGGNAAAASTDAQAQATSSDSIAASARLLSAAPPVDTERVAEIRRAIADGRFPIMPATIADRMLALKLNWRPNE